MTDNSSVVTDALIAILIAFSTIVIYVLLLSKSTVGLKFLNKGYGFFFRLATGIVCMAFSLLASAYGIYLLITPKSSISLWLWGFVFVPYCVVSIVLMQAVVSLLPQRNNRRAGRRELPFIFSTAAKRLERGLVILGLMLPTILLGMFFLKDGIGFRQLFETFAKISGGVLLLTVAIPRLFSYLRERASSPTIEEASALDSRPPVMYLRAFSNEGAFFTSGSEDEMAPYKKNILPFGLRVFVTFELYFRKTFSDSLGPLVALGNPQDELTPAGAVREYAADSEWKSRFRELAASSIAFVMQPSNTASLQWELGELRSMQLMHKLFIITSPDKPQGRSIARLFDPPSSSQLSPDWSEFRSAMTGLGLLVDVQDPGAGAVISFQRNGRALLLTRGAITPEQYVSVINSHLTALAHGAKD